MNKDKIKGALKEAVDSLFRIQGEKDLMKDIAERMKDEEDFEKAKWNKLVTFSYNQEVETKIADLQEIADMVAEYDVS